MTLWTMFEEVAERYCERVAVEVQRSDGLEQWTYARLHASAVWYAAILEDLGVTAGDRCAILADDDARWCAAYFGILRLGAVAVPLDTGYTIADITTVIGDAQPRVLLTNERLTAAASEAAASVNNITLIVPLRSPPAESASPDRVPAPVAPSDAAVILYTAGTTARPKGVVLTHANLLAARDAALAVVSMSEADRVLGGFPLFHALAQLATLLLPVAVGARVVLLETFTSAELFRALAERRITVCACVPHWLYLFHQRVFGEIARAGPLRRTAYRTMLSANFRLRAAGFNLGKLLFPRQHSVLGGQMRYLLTGGSRFDPVIGRDLQALGLTILQAYGLTETSGAATLTEPGDAYGDTVGRPLTGNEVRILPADNAEADGEIAIRGPVVMQGYFKRPDATAAVMRDGWFLTGDLGRVDGAGRLAITGRKVDVVAPAGKSIHPEEIEAQYRQSSFVKELCVMGLPGPGEQLYAVVVPDLDLMRARRIVNAGDLLRFEIEGQSSHLPPHKRVLGYEVSFDPLPRTATGNLKRREILRRVIDKQRATVAPLGGELPAEWRTGDNALAVVDVIVCHARGRLITPDANLELDLGLDSLARVELIADIEQRLGVCIAADAADAIFTVRQLVEAARGEASPALQGAKEEPWAFILRDLPSSDDPMLSPLVVRRRLMPALLFAVIRVLRLFMPRLEAVGLEQLPPRGPYMICPNHQSYLDPFFVCSVLPYQVFRQLFFVGASEYFATPLTAWLARQCNLIPVDPDANLIPAMKAGAFGLSRGKILMLFPEGERSIDGAVKRFKKGAPILSRHLDVPIVPVAIDGVFELWPRNRSFNWRLLLPGARHRIRLAFGHAMRVSNDRTYAESAGELRERVVTLWAALHNSPKRRSEQHRGSDGDRKNDEKLGAVTDKN